MLFRSDAPGGTAVDLADRHDAIAGDAHVGDAGRRAGSIDDEAAPDDEVEIHGRRR